MWIKVFSKTAFKPLPLCGEETLTTAGDVHNLGQYFEFAVASMGKAIGRGSRACYAESYDFSHSLAATPR